MNFFLLPLLLFATGVRAAVILIDPGHGGNEVGAIGVINPKSKHPQSFNEKDLTLQFSAILKKQLEKKHLVYLTRTSDRFVSLDERAKLADTVKADLFISLHFNSSTDHSAYGIETYYLDNHDDKAVKKVETVENAELIGNNQIINKILIDLSIKLTTHHSKILAQKIHEKSLTALRKKFKVRDRGYKAGLLYVLALSKRPGVLIEGGFISQPHELEKMQNSAYLQQYAIGISAGIDEYFKVKQ